MRISDDRYELDRRHHDLARWMVAHGAKTRSVMQWTGLTEYRIQQLARRYVATDGTVRRGIAPSQPAYFGKSPEHETHSLAFIYVAAEMQVIPQDIVPDARRVLPELARGERLMDSYECYIALVGVPQLTLERAILLVYEYAQRKNLSLRLCELCRDLMMTARFGRHVRCPFCRKDVSFDCVPLNSTL
jgi:uncharacterized CHY-type Zn-finger protein